MEMFGLGDILSDAAGFVNGVESVFMTVTQTEVVSRITHVPVPPASSASEPNSWPLGPSFNAGPTSITLPLVPLATPAPTYHFKPTPPSGDSPGLAFSEIPDDPSPTPTSQSSSQSSTSSPLMIASPSQSESSSSSSTSSSSTSPTSSVVSTPTSESTNLPSLFDPNTAAQHHGPSKAVIAGATVGGLVALAAILALLILCCRRRRRTTLTRHARQGSIESVHSSEASFFGEPHRRAVWSPPRPTHRTRSIRNKNISISGPWPHITNPQISSAPIPAPAPALSRPDRTDLANGQEMKIARKPLPSSVSSLIPASHWRSNWSSAPADPAQTAIPAAELAEQPTPRQAVTTREQPVISHTRGRSIPTLAPPLPIIPTTSSQARGTAAPVRPQRPRSPVADGRAQIREQPLDEQQELKLADERPDVPGSRQNRFSELHFDFDLTPGGQYNRQAGYMHKRGQPPPRFNLAANQPGRMTDKPRPTNLELSSPTTQKTNNAAAQPTNSNNTTTAVSSQAPVPRDNSPPQPRRQRGPAIRLVTPTDSSFPMHLHSRSTSSVEQTYPPTSQPALSNNAPPPRGPAPQQQHHHHHRPPPAPRYQPYANPHNPSPLNPHPAPRPHIPGPHISGPHIPGPSPAFSASPAFPPSATSQPPAWNPYGSAGAYVPSGLSPAWTPASGYPPSASASAGASANSAYARSSYGYPAPHHPQGYHSAQGNFTNQPPSAGRASYAHSNWSAATSRRVSYDEYGRRRRSDPFDIE